MNRYLIIFVSFQFVVSDLNNAACESPHCLRNNGCHEHLICQFEGISYLWSLTGIIKESTDSFLLVLIFLVNYT